MWYLPCWNTDPCCARLTHHQNGTIDLTYVPFDEHGYVHPDDIKNAIRPNTKFVVVTHCSNVLGTIQPLTEIGKICKEERRDLRG
ncbi:MAG: aminotransferase class V-fold PLP-dependent enzyme [Butyricimonas faecihominis]